MDYVFTKSDEEPDMPEKLKEETIRKGEEFLGYGWPTTLATMYLEFTRTGNRAVVDKVNSAHREALRSLVFAELMEGKGRFMDDIVNGVFFLCEQTYWGSSAHFYLYGFEGSVDNPTTVLPDSDDPIIDLRVGDLAADLAWTWYFFHDEFDKISPVISRRLKDEIKKKVSEPYYERYDLWWITGWGEGRVNNWNPWINYNILTCILLLEEDQEKKENSIYKTMESVDLFINSYPDDGACSEGPSYWGHAGGKMFEYLDLLKRSTQGEVDIFDHELIKNMGSYIYRVYIGNGNYYVNFADAPLKINHDPGHIYRFGRSIQDETMQAFGTFLLKESGYGSQSIVEALGTTLENLFNLNGYEDVPPAEPLISDYYFPDLDLAVARDKAGTNSGFYFAAKGGSNGERHNHNDVGSFMLYFNSQPVLIDVGAGTYTRETFGRGRYDIWTMQSNYHNLPVINGEGQHNGGTFKAKNSKFARTENKVSYSTDIAAAYTEAAEVTAWRRTYTLDRSGRFTIKDNFQRIASNGETSINFMSGIPCQIVKEGIIAFQGTDFTLHMKYNPKQLTTEIEQIEITDPKLEKSLGKEISRVVFNLTERSLTGEVTFEITAL